MGNVEILVLENYSNLRYKLHKTTLNDNWNIIIDNIKSFHSVHVSLENFKLIIMDFIFPNDNVINIINKIQSKDIPLVLITAKGAAGSRIQGFELGALDCIEESVSSEELTFRIKAIIKRVVN